MYCTYLCTLDLIEHIVFSNNEQNKRADSVAILEFVNTANININNETIEISEFYYNT